MTKEASLVDEHRIIVVVLVAVVVAVAAAAAAIFSEGTDEGKKERNDEQGVPKNCKPRLPVIK